ncbi:hypothetical protein [Phycicoccus sp. Soil803]|uniref:hypothetical protein n=1 Tax=Phycicoccus sp. Soil803 TaxID=1736415 RepID=UPI00070DEC29|nr:hypothetical protein [Phycicoccus sp. Soil803]KRF26203.1 hypothetical protein ASG95_18365 [Phycicoccus sp. Soil803]
MPSSTDRTHHTTATTPADPGAPTPAAPSGTGQGPVWPLTALVVLLGWCLLAWTVFAGAINTAPFFGETASRDRYVESGMVTLTALVPVALLLVLGRLAGSRWGLALLAAPGLLLVPLGLSMLGEGGDPAKSGHGRGVRWEDAFQDLTRLNWVATAVLLVVIAAVAWRRRRRQTAIRANP